MKFRLRDDYTDCFILGMDDAMQLPDLQKNSPKYEDEGKMVCINKTPRKHYRISEKDCYICFQSSLSLKKRLKSLQTNFPVFVEQKTYG